MDPSLDKINAKIPKQVRDDNERDFQKVMTGIIANVISKTPKSVMLNLFQHLAPKNRCTRKIQDPLNAEGCKNRERAYPRVRIAHEKRRAEKGADRVLWSHFSRPLAAERSNDPETSSG
ncbi:hypothetical protein V513_11180 [Mesotoga sp. H07.pep.5.3]|nr:hypothetical protein V513_11180 [Mesotoga sp. H07.pep.5.3]